MLQAKSVNNTSKGYHSVIVLTSYFLDFFCGIDLRSWDRAVSKKEMNERLGAFMRINSSTSTIIGYQWCFMSNISYLLEVNLHHGFERNHNFVSVAVNKHSKSSRPFYYQTTLVPTPFFFSFCRFLFRKWRTRR